MDVGGAPSRGEGVPDTQGSVVQKTLPPPTCPGPSRGGEPRAQAVFATSQALLCAAASTEEPRAGQGSAHLGSEGEVSGISRSPPTRLTGAYNTLWFRWRRRCLLPPADHRRSLNPPAGQRHYPRWKEAATWKGGEGRAPRGQQRLPHTHAGLKGSRLTARSPANSPANHRLSVLRGRGSPGDTSTSDLSCGTQARTGLV